MAATESGDQDHVNHVVKKRKDHVSHELHPCCVSKRGKKNL
jgi:hypothetical protein